VRKKKKKRKKMMSKPIKAGLVLGIVVSIPFLFYSYLQYSLRDTPLESSTILQEVNQKRKESETVRLEENKDLSLIAEKKLDDMLERNYFDHTSPTGEEIDAIATDVGYEFIIIGENLIRGRFKDEKDVVQAWMESPGHRENILNENYLETGVASRYGKLNETKMFVSVQVFATPVSVCPQMDDELVSRIDEKEEQLKELEETIREEDSRVEHNIIIEEYNDLASKTTSLIEKYNEIIDQKEKCFSGYR